MIEFDEVCRPVIFEQENEEFPYWGKGSSFLIAKINYYYWVTASHVLINMGGNADSLRIYPSDNSTISLPFNEQYTVKKILTDDDEFKDIFMLRIDLNDFHTSGDAPLKALNIEKALLRAEQLKINDELFVIGYPAEKNFIDYDSCEIKNTRIALRAVYKGRSISDNCHELIIESSIKLKHFDGLSGSPVFHMKKVNLGGQAVTCPLLVGMLLRGTASSGIAHFVSSSVIVDFVNYAENNA